MTVRRILATSGGFVAAERWGQIKPGAMMRQALALTGKTRPRVCLVLTASGDDVSYYARSYEALNAAGCDVTQLALFPQPSAPAEERLCRADLIWVGGGSVANLLSVWKLHEVDRAMEAAWESGVILGGVSAGSICWHSGGTTDSFGPELRAVTNGLGLLPYANGVHYDSEAQRRPLLHELVGSGVLDPIAFATDDRIGILYEGVEPVEVMSDFDEPEPRGPAAYRIERVDQGVIETRLHVGPIRP